MPGRFKRNLLVGVTLAAALALSSVGLGGTAEEEEFDRLDGKGASGAKIDVIEWAENLEIHSYPKGHLTGLALKLDEKNGKKVMVVGYRFKSNPKKQLIRRALVSIPFRAGFTAYRDPSTDEYDKMIISNSSLAGNLQLVKLDPEPKQLYPDGHPDNITTAERLPATLPSTERPTEAPTSAAPVTAPTGAQQPKNFDQDTGSVKSFSW